MRNCVGVTIRTGAEVVGVEVDGAGRSLRHPRRTGVARGVRLASGEVLEADVVVSGADLYETETALLKINGIGRSKLDRYGAAVLAVIRQG